MAAGGTISSNYRKNICQKFLFLQTLFHLRFPSFAVIYFKEIERWIGLFPSLDWDLFWEKSYKIYGTKKVIFGYFSHILKIDFAKTTVIFQIKTLIYKKNENWDQKCLGILRDAIWKKYCHTLNQQTRICEIAKFRAKMKNLKYGTKILNMHYLGLFGLQF